MKTFRLKPLARQPPLKERYDLIIVGGGPAGLTAALYAARLMLDTLVIAEKPGGLLNEIGVIENFPGFTRISGPELARRMLEQVRSWGVPVLQDKVVEVSRGAKEFIVKTVSSKVLKSKAVILAVGLRRRRLGVPGESELVGKGVSYCAVCDAPLYRGKVVAVVGGGDSAASSALLLAQYASKVYLVHRRDQLRAQPVYAKMLLENPKIEILYNRVVERIVGVERVEAIELRDVVTNEKQMLKVDGVFIEIGFEPHREFLEKIGVELDEKGYVKVSNDMSTNIPGLFAAGDCTNTGLKQVIVAAAQGAIAAYAAYRYIKGLEG